MRRFFSNHTIVIILFALLLGYVSAPSEYHVIPGTPDIIKNAKVHLGLDLQGGSQLDYKIDLRKVPEEDRDSIVEGVREVINRRVNALGVSEPNIYVSHVADETHIIVELAGIKDLNQAKAAVGKTIQLEFKEEKGALDPGEPEAIKKQADDILRRARAEGADFAFIGQEEELANPTRVQYEEVDFLFRDGIQGGALADAVFAAPVGTVVPRLIESSEGLRLDQATNSVVPLEFYFAVKVLERNEEAEKEVSEPKEVSASHVLVAYSGASGADAALERSRDEAKKIAEDVLEKALAGGAEGAKNADFGALAAEFSNEPGAAESKGVLSESVKEGSSYGIPFTEGALELKSDGEVLDRVVETEFGFHVIKADSVKAEKKETVKEPQVKFEKIMISKEPDPWKATGLTGEQFVRANVQFDELLQPYVAISFDEEGATLFEEITGRNAPVDGGEGRRIAIFVGGQFISAPQVQARISGGQAIITGVGDANSAEALARDLNTGAIPAPILLTGQYTIGASLGQSALDTSLQAGFIGLAILALFMLLYYRLPGLIANISLLIYSGILLFLIRGALPLPVALGIAVVIFISLVYKIINSEDSGWEKLLTFILSCFVLFFITFLLSTPIVLTLAGIAGIILSIGMAVDANILIFERMKEEIRAGRPLSSAIEIGFARAWTSIRDSNFSSLITAGILFYFGSSIIRGFALMLAAGILISMFSAITITRHLLASFVHTGFANRLSFWCHNPEGKPRKPFRIVENSKIWFGLSGAALAISIFALLMNGLHLGIDFTGGSLMDVRAKGAIAMEDVREVLAQTQEQRFGATENGAENEAPAPAPAPGAPSLAPVNSAKIDLTKASLVESGENQFLLRTEHMDEATHALLLKNFESRFGTVEEIRFTTIGPTIGSTMQKKAIGALAFAMFMIVLYVSFAFRKVPKHVSAVKFGLAAILALIHDVTITLGLFALFQFEVNALFITALLTIIGFSVHDTIVVMDRIRENLRSKHLANFKEATNLSLTETMARSLNTSISTLFTLVALLVYGSDSIWHFVLALVVGMIVGTYSSIFIASPILAKWQKDI